MGRRKDFCRFVTRGVKKSGLAIGVINQINGRLIQNLKSIMLMKMMEPSGSRSQTIPRSSISLLSVSTKNNSKTIQLLTCMKLEVLVFANLNWIRM